MSLSSELRHDVIMLCILFDVEHDERYVTLFKLSSKFGSCCLRSTTALDMKSSCFASYLVLSTTIPSVKYSRSRVTMSKMISTRVTPVSTFTGGRWPCGNRTTRVPQSEALDETTPHLRSVDATNREGVRLLRLLGDTESQEMASNNNPEQKFFLIDREHYVKRPVPIACGRPSLEGQEECLNYFGTLTPKVKAVLVDFHTEMWKLGISDAVMHNEVAPGQQEISPIFASSNVSADQNALCQVFFLSFVSVMAYAINVHGDTPARKYRTCWEWSQAGSTGSASRHHLSRDGPELGGAPEKRCCRWISGGLW